MRALSIARYNAGALNQRNNTSTRSQAAARFSSENLRGLLLPVPTPFEAGGEVDVRALHVNIARWNETGVRGYVVLGSTGEAAHLDERERRMVIEAARAATPAQMTFIVGAGQPSTRATIAETRSAAAAGAEAVLVITPYYYRGAMTAAALVDHYRAVADASPVPVVLYSMPQLTGIALAPETIAQLSEHENIIGVKDSSGDIVNLAETRRLVPRDFAVLVGHGAAFYPGLCMGAMGGILAAGCVAPEAALVILRAVAAGDHERARDMQQKFGPLAQAVTARYGIGGLKAALEMRGYCGGPVRAPLKDASPEARHEIKNLLDAVMSASSIPVSRDQSPSGGILSAGAPKQ